MATVSTARTGLPTARTPEEAPGPRSRSRRLVHAAGALVWSEVVARVVADTARTDHPVTVVSTSVHDILDGIALSQI